MSPITELLDERSGRAKIDERSESIAGQVQVASLMTSLLVEMELNIIVIRCWSLYLPAGNVTIWLELRVKKIHLKKKCVANADWVASENLS